MGSKEFSDIASDIDLDPGQCFKIAGPVRLCRIVLDQVGEAPVDIDDARFQVRKRDQKLIIPTQSIAAVVALYLQQEVLQLSDGELNLLGMGGPLLGVV